jgi:uncharacterized protein (UPF0264 family)
MRPDRISRVRVGSNAPGGGGLARMPPVIDLLVSVADLDEVPAALAGGADVVDLKAPPDGSLGAPEPALLEAVAASLRRAAGRPGAGRRLSVALGDASLPPAGPGPGTYALAARACALAGADYVKIGLRGEMTDGAAAGLVAALARAVRAVSPRTRVIAAGFADASEAGGVGPERLVPIAVAGGADGLLVDTARKDGRRLLDWLAPDALARLAAAARRRGLLVGLAGSLRVDDLPVVAAAGPDLVGVRGAACAGGRRDGRVDAGRVARLRAALARGGVPSAARFIP